MIMANLNTEDDNFFDAPEAINPEPDSPSEASEGSTSELQLDVKALENLHNKFFLGHPKSVDERRDEFIRQTGFVLERCLTARDQAFDESIYEHNGNATGNTGHSSRRDNQGDDNLISPLGENGDEREGFWWKTCVSDGRQFGGRKSQKFDRFGLKKCATAETFRSSSRHDHQQFFRQEPEVESDVEGMRKVRCRRDWFKKLSFKASNMFSSKESKSSSSNCCAVFGPESERIRVRSHKKWSKELSSLYKIQDFSAHRGSIFSMKFSHDGQNLATGGEDGKLFIWQIIEEETPSCSDNLSISSASACLYFSVNGISDFASFLKIKEERNVIDKLKNFLDSACIMLPRTVFHIVERPIFEFHGHEGEILDISWSKEGYLLSCSDDKTVRLWQLGHVKCLRVFPHSDYVTCAQFNPVNNNQFITGSIDGIVRVWDVHGCCVVDWIDYKEMITAICYHPHGKGGIVGSMSGSCSFFEIKDDCPRGHVINMLERGKLAGKRITGFQFSPTDPNVVVVGSADSQIRILRGSNLVCKLRGSLREIKDGGVPPIASFTSDGKHVISAADDSDVYMWTHLDNERVRVSNKAKTVWACESFSANNSLIAVPWHGFRPPEELNSTCKDHFSTPAPNNNQHQLDDNLGQESSSGESSSQPKEDVPRLNPTVVLPTVGKIDYELLKKVCETILTGAHMLGLVIVTEGKDGRIKTFHNYGLPTRAAKQKSLKKVTSTKFVKDE